MEVAAFGRNYRLFLAQAVPPFTTKVSGGDTWQYNKASAAVYPGALAAGTVPQYNTINYGTCIKIERNINVCRKLNPRFVALPGRNPVTTLAESLPEWQSVRGVSCQFQTHTNMELCAMPEASGSLVSSVEESGKNTLFATGN